MKKLQHIPGFVLVALFLSIGCTTEFWDQDQYGTLKIEITDAPFPIDMIDSAMIEIQEIEVRLKGDTTDGEFMVISTDTLMYNLMELRNGITASMVETDLPEGKIDLIRLHIVKASLVLTNGEMHSVKVPSGSSSGIKVFVKPAIEIKGGLVSEVLLDFSLEESFLLKGNVKTPAGIKGFNFKPVIRAINKTQTGTVAGKVMDSSQMILGNAAVWIEQDTLVASTTTDTTGFYAFPGVEEGAYNISATFEGFDTVTYDIEVVRGNLTEKYFELTPLSSGE